MRLRITHTKNNYPFFKFKKRKHNDCHKKRIDNFNSISNINIALKKLTKDYIFFNATPPKFHYQTTKLILSWI